MNIVNLVGSRNHANSLTNATSKRSRRNMIFVACLSKNILMTKLLRIIKVFCHVFYMYDLNFPRPLLAS